MNEIFSNISPTIQKLNIIHFSTSVFPTDYDYMNIPHTIKYLNINCFNAKNFKQTNLPIDLKMITVTVIRPQSNMKKNETIELITNNVKTPFNCILTINTDY